MVRGARTGGQPSAAVHQNKIFTRPGRAPRASRRPHTTPRAPALTPRTLVSPTAAAAPPTTTAYANHRRQKHKWESAGASASPIPSRPSRAGPGMHNSPPPPPQREAPTLPPARGRTPRRPRPSQPAHALPRVADRTIGRLPRPQRLLACHPQCGPVQAKQCRPANSHRGCDGAHRSPTSPGAARSTATAVARARTAH